MKKATPACKNKFRDGATSKFRLFLTSLFTFRSGSCMAYEAVFIYSILA